MSNRSNRTTGRVSMPARGAGLCLVSLLAIVATGAGCARARAASVPQGPPLSVPAPPERVLVPVEAEEPRAEAPAPSAVPPAPPPARTEKPPQQPRNRAETETRTEPAPPAPAAPVAAATEKPSLQIAPSPGESAATEARVNTLLGRYTRAMKQVDESRLSAPQRLNVTEARRHERQARDYLMARNYQAASAAAEKAAILAESLLK